MKQRRFARSQPRDDEHVIEPVATGMQLSVDDIVVSKSLSDTSKLSASGNANITIILDQFSGMPLATPSASSSEDKIYARLRHFVGPGRLSPEVVVKSDASPAILAAIKALGWTPDTSLA